MVSISYSLCSDSHPAAKKTCVIGGDIGAKLVAARKQFEALSDALRRTPLGTLLPALLSSMTLLLDQTGAAASAAASASVSATGAADASLADAQAKATSGSTSGSGSALPASFALKAAPACLATLRLLQAFQVRCWQNVPRVFIRVFKNPNINTLKTDAVTVNVLSYMSKINHSMDGMHSHILSVSAICMCSDAAGALGAGGAR